MNPRFVGLSILLAILLMITTSCNLFTKPDQNRVAKPTFSPEGGAYEYGQSISIFCSTPGASIFYSVDGSAPTIPYTGPIILRNTSFTLKAVATRLEWNDSPVATSAYNIGRLPMPSFSPVGGTYYNPQTVSLSSEMDGVTIRYTTDGSEPTESSPVYVSPIEVAASTTIKAIAFKTGWLESQVRTAGYDMLVANPVFSPIGGTYTSPQNVTISCATIGATIRYTVDGTEPTESSPIYSQAIHVSAETTIKARGFMTDWLPSMTKTATYVITGIIATPIITPAGGTYATQQSVNLSCATAGTQIRYTTDGSEPTATSTLFGATINVAVNTTIKAKGFRTGWIPSETATASYVINSLTLVQGGIFNNGSSSITLSSFYIDKYEVTQASYQLVMGTNPSHFSDNTNHPVDNISWFKAIEYCNNRSIQEGFTPCYSYSSYGTNPDNWPAGWNTSYTNHTNVSCNWTANGYRLPTEMEWMFAARGGNQSQGYTYSGSNTIGNVAWYYENSGGTTHAVGTKAPNELGIYDMSGNVFERCWDIYGTYPSGAQTNPHGASSGSDRVLRGGGWASSASYCTVSLRTNSNATFAYSDSGFRCVRISP